jgi:hypothetical protein
MEHRTKKPGEEKEIPAFGPDSIEAAMRLRIRTIEDLVKEELDAALVHQSQLASASGVRATVMARGSGR